MSILRNRAFQAAVSLAIGAVFLWLAIARIDINQLWAKLRQVEVQWLALAMVGYWVALTLRSWRWRIILTPVRRMPLGAVLQITGARHALPLPADDADNRIRVAESQGANATVTERGYPA